MKQPRATTVAACIIVLAVAAGWAWWLYESRGPGPLTLSSATFSDLPEWSTNDPRPAIAAFRRSCAAILQKPPSQKMGGEGYAGTAGDWMAVCSHIPNAQTEEGARRWLEANFTPVLVAAGSDTNGLFTGYYEPELRGSETAHGDYREPVYARPDDLIDVDLGDFRDALKGERIAGRVDGKRLVPYATRAEIDAQGLKHSRVLFYAPDPVAVFFLHIQGSGRVKLDDGRALRVAYDGQNGQPYTPIGRSLIEQGAIDKEHMSMQAIRTWMLANPKMARAVMETDKSFVFFKTLPVGDPSLGADGAQGVPLTPGASLAVDPRVHAFGVPMFVTAQAPADNPDQGEVAFNRLLVAQDMGGAIRGAVRGDVYWGYGSHAESLAGRMKSEGKLYVLLPKALAARATKAQS
jgi:membrane-bound lytic murein transglycosylase A